MNNFRKNLILWLSKPTETPEVIDQIVQDMFSFMPKENRMAFIEKMVPKYGEMAMAHLKPEDKKIESEKLQKKLCDKIEEVNTISVKWLNTPADQRAEINCC